MESIRGMGLQRTGHLVAGNDAVFLLPVDPALADIQITDSQRLAIPHHILGIHGVIEMIVTLAAVKSQCPGVDPGFQFAVERLDFPLMDGDGGCEPFMTDEPMNGDFVVAGIQGHVKSAVTREAAQGFVYAGVLKDIAPGVCNTNPCG